MMASPCHERAIERRQSYVSHKVARHHGADWVVAAQRPADRSQEPYHAERPCMRLILCETSQRPLGAISPVRQRLMEEKGGIKQLPDFLAVCENAYPNAAS